MGERAANPVSREWKKDKVTPVKMGFSCLIGLPVAFYFPLLVLGRKVMLAFVVSDTNYRTVDIWVAA